MAGLLAYRQENRHFTTSKIGTLYADLRIPAPVNISDLLGKLRLRHQVIKGKGGTWALTPLGESKVLDLLEHLGYEQVAAELAGSPGAQLGDVLHPLIG